LPQPYELSAPRLPLPDIFETSTGDRKRFAGGVVSEPGGLLSGPI
jgi:hypothetical protein